MPSASPIDRQIDRAAVAELRNARVALERAYLDSKGRATIPVVLSHEQVRLVLEFLNGKIG